MDYFREHYMYIYDFFWAVYTVHTLPLRLLVKV